MSGCVSCRLFLLLGALENLDISLDLRSHEISNFQRHLEVNKVKPTGKHILA